MGAWGFESCSNDACWDRLECEDIHECTGEEIENSLKSSFKVILKYDQDFDSECVHYLGIVIWGLTHKVKVRVDHLHRALIIANKLLKSKDYLDAWSTPDQRERCLEQEITWINYAIDHNGFPPENIEEPEGLFDKMFDDLS
jgi:hypothetical protein